VLDPTGHSGRAVITQIELLAKFERMEAEKHVRNVRPGGRAESLEDSRPSSLRS
jgi:hypothetical protein